MALRNAIGTSLFAVTAFGAATASSYAASGLVDWRTALLVIAGGVSGSLIGTHANARLALHRHALSVTFAGVIIAVGLYVAVSGLGKLIALG